MNEELEKELRENMELYLPTPSKSSVAFAPVALR